MTDKPSAEVIEAFRIAEQEMQEEWEARQAHAAAYEGPGAHLRPEILAAHWLIVFAPARVKLVLEYGVPIGNVLDILKHQEGRVLPPAVEAVWREWHEKIEAARLERDVGYPWWEREARKIERKLVRRHRHRNKARRAP